MLQCRFPWLALQEHDYGSLSVAHAVSLLYCMVLLSASNGLLEDGALSAVAQLELLAYNLTTVCHPPRTTVSESQRLRDG